MREAPRGFAGTSGALVPGMLHPLSSASWQPRVAAEDDVLAGLRAPRKWLPPRLLRDDAGAALYEEVTRLSDHYWSPVEQTLLRAHLGTIAQHVGPGARVIEPACGEGVLTRMLLRGLACPSSYVPVDLAPGQLAGLAAELRRRHPGLVVQPVFADPSQPFELPATERDAPRTLMVLAGAALGKLEPHAARALLTRLAALAGPDHLLLLGVDATRDPARILRAHADDEGVVQAYTRSALAHLNRTRAASFDLQAFTHRAVWSAAACRVELQLVSTGRQVVRVDGHPVAFAHGETVTVLHHIQHTPEATLLLLASGGWRPRQVFTPEEVPYRLWLCEPARPLR